MFGRWPWWPSGGYNRRMRRLPVALIFFPVVSPESEKAIVTVLCVVAVKEDHIAFF
jgi:hypothetical protein